LFPTWEVAKAHLSLLWLILQLDAMT